MIEILAYRHMLVCWYYRSNQRRMARHPKFFFIHLYCFPAINHQIVKFWLKIPLKILSRRFFHILWPSQNIRTLLWIQLKWKLNSQLFWTNFRIDWLFNESRGEIIFFARNNNQSDLKEALPLSICTWFLKNSSLKYWVWWVLVYLKLEYCRLHRP